MKVINNGQTIIVEAEFVEMATIVQVLQDSKAYRDEEFVQELVNQLKNPIVKLF